MATSIFTKFGWYDVGPILMPYLEGHDWSMWAWLSTTNPNWHTFSLLHFQCNSHGSDVGLCPHFCPEPIIFWAQLPWALRCMGSASCRGAWPPFITACSSSYPCFFSGLVQFFLFTLLFFISLPQFSTIVYSLGLKVSDQVSAGTLPARGRGTAPAVYSQE